MSWGGPDDGTGVTDADNGGVVVAGDATADDPTSTVIEYGSGAERDAEDISGHGNHLGWRRPSGFTRND